MSSITQTTTTNYNLPFLDAVVLLKSHSFEGNLHESNSISRLTLHESYDRGVRSRAKILYKSMNKVSLNSLMITNETINAPKIRKQRNVPFVFFFFPDEMTYKGDANEFFSDHQPGNPGYHKNSPQAPQTRCPRYRGRFHGKQFGQSS